MARLIDADELRKEIDKQAYPHSDSTANDIYFSVLHLLADAPTVDAVEVVRCKDCEAYQTKNRQFPRCRITGRMRGAYDYCSDGYTGDGE